MARDVLDEHRLRRLIEVGRRLVAQLDLEAVLREVVEVARELTGARYAALGILDEDRRGFERLVEVGVGGGMPAPAGELASWHGDGFLGVPIVVRGQALGSLYLADEGGELSGADEEAVTILAEWAAVAIFNVRLYAQSEEERDALERAVHGFEATTEIARAVVGETDRARVLGTIAKRARALVGAGSLLVLLRDGSQFEIAAAAGKCGEEPVGGSVAIGDGAAEEALAGARAAGVDARASLFAPIDFRGKTLGAILALDRLEGGPGFNPEDARLLDAAATSAATAVATLQSVTEGRLRQSMKAAERERARWARELHDTVLQGMGSRRLLLSSVLKSGSDPATLKSAVEEALATASRDLEELRGLINELRPATLDQLGLVAALEDLTERFGNNAGVEVEASLEVGAAPLDSELEVAVYRLVQEALNNVAKHAEASRVELRVGNEADRLEVLVVDDGGGFEPSGAHDGFGLIGMRERVELVGGELRIESRPGAGTRVQAAVPLLPRSDSGGSDVD